MNTRALKILRIGLWGGYIKPWVLNWTYFFTLEDTMKATAVLDIIIGLMFLARPLVTPKTRRKLY